jgi:Protein tyrosine and serine/threonine kinase
MERASDVYSFGVIMWEVYSSQRPFVRRSTGAFSRHPALGSFPPYAPLNFALLSAACMSREPNERPTFQTALEVLSALASEVAEGKYTDLCGLRQSAELLTRKCELGPVPGDAVATLSRQSSAAAHAVPTASGQNATGTTAAHVVPASSNNDDAAAAPGRRPQPSAQPRSAAATAAAPPPPQRGAPRAASAGVQLAQMPPRPARRTPPPESQEQQPIDSVAAAIACMEFEASDGESTPRASEDGDEPLPERAVAQWLLESACVERARQAALEAAEAREASQRGADSATSESSSPSASPQ